MYNILLCFNAQDQSLRIQFRLPFFGTVKFNPVVTALSLAIVWFFVIWCIKDQGNVPFASWKSGLTDLFTWFYIGCFSLFGIFLIYINFRYRHFIQLFL